MITKKSLLGKLKNFNNLLLAKIAEGIISRYSFCNLDGLAKELVALNNAFISDRYILTAIEEICANLKVLEELIGTPPAPGIVFLGNFLDGHTPTYPVGVFNVNGVYLGIADDKDEYVVLWNSDVDNQAEGTIQATDNPYEFRFPLGTTLTKVIGLRYWQIYLDSASSFLYLSDDTYIELANGTIIKSEDSPLGVPTAEFNMTTLLTTTPLSTSITTDAFRKVTVTVGNLRIFHNETGSYAAMNVSGLWKNNYGNLPPTVKCISFYRIAQDADVNNISPLNYINYYAATKNVELFQVNCSRITWTPTYIAHMNKLKAFQFLNNGAVIENRYFSNYGFSAATHPDLKQIVLRYNLKASLGVISVADFSVLPSLVWGIDLNGAQMNTPADFDNILIGLAAIMTPPAMAGTRIAIQQQAVARTAASNAAVTYLQGLGYSVLGV